MAKKPSQSRKLSVYSNLSHRRKARKDTELRRKAEYLASLPKHPVSRFFHRLHPKRLWAYWFSKRGLIMALKMTGVTILLLCLIVGALFAYFRKDLDAIRPGELAKRVQTTVTKYYDRNGILLWEDKGDGNYKLVVDSKDLSKNLKNATVAIEDRDFYSHNGVSVTGLLRAAVNNASGGGTQGGSTLTQQLVKQVFFADQSGDRGLSGVPRKIKELILSVEVERMYDKDQILSLYLNESPYGGRGNGAESGAKTYFNKSAKDLTIAEAALLAAIPQNPNLYNPYVVEGHQALIARQHKVLDNMREMNYITQAEEDEAKAYPILDSIKPETSQLKDIKAPHFVQMVRSELQNKLGATTVGRGGLSITTTLDYRIQQQLEEAMTTMFASTRDETAGFSNGAATVEDVKTGQIVALLGSRDFLYEGFGQDNAATAYIQPGSTIKPLVYSELFEQKPDGQRNYGSGTILKDENIDALYGAKLQNADRKFLGDITIRRSLATSRNVPAVKAMAINEKVADGSTLKTIHELGAPSYCSEGGDTTVGLAAAIGGCGIKQTDLVNAYASLARGGAYKPQSTILEVKNSSGDTLQKWTDTEGKKIVSPESSYVVSDILTDPVARAALANPSSMNIPGVKTATKTGTSDKGGFAKDIWMMSYSPVLAMGVWLGNPDTTILNNGSSTIPGPIIEQVMNYAHKEVYATEGKWKSGDWFTQPAGIQRIGSEVYPPWWNKNQGQTNATMAFDKVSKKKATDCTPDAARISLGVTKTTDPISKKETILAPDGYDASAEDDVHQCSDVKPSVSVTVTKEGGNNYKITANPTKGTFALDELTVSVGGSVVSTIAAPGPYTYTYTGNGSGSQTVTVQIKDDGLYTADASAPLK
ncbi:MAG: hypothetical protein JWN33_368 [Candidatus Saccharibacteria bacterium]|nr:hypothetical protein [Candidatus Saccharibacteria bacterium]